MKNLTLHNVTVSWRLKIDLSESSQKFYFEVFESKSAWNGPKIRFSKFYQKLQPGIFSDFFASSWSNLKT